MTQLYLVVNSNTPSMSFDIAIRTAFPGKHFRYNDSVWLVAGDDISAPHTISAAIGIGEKDGLNAIVVSVATFYGAADQPLMEWLSKHRFSDRQPAPPMETANLPKLIPQLSEVK